MLFKVKHLEGIKAGKISLAFRKWKILAVTPESLHKTAVGIIQVGSVEEVDLYEINDDDAQQAGFKTAAALVQLLEQQKEGAVYRIEVSYHSEDPRIELRETVSLDEEDFLALKADLENLDKYSKVGKWTLKTLQLIRENPKLKAADLAVKARKEKEWLKLNIRKLKNLGLTVSHEPGYTLSERGEAYLAKLGL